MKRLGTRVNLIPIVAKADTLTPADLAGFKQKVSHVIILRRVETDKGNVQIREVIKAQGIRVYTPPIEADDEASAEHSRSITVS